MARALDPGLRKKGQYGGSTTALILLALELGRINGAILTGQGKNGEPEGRVCRTRVEVLECAGSKYSGAGTLSVLSPLLETGEGPWGLVGTPCQVTAVGNIQSHRIREGRSNEKFGLKIGLFCTWSLPYAPFRKLLDAKGIDAPILKYDIPPPPAEELLIQTRTKRYRIPLGEVRPLVPRGCLACGDMTAESADIAVGSAEGVPGWNTILIRTGRGMDLFREALARKALEVKPLPEPNWEHLRAAVSGKKRKAMAELEQLHG
jgi:coenzyme F420 hydrogenase subunit beta